MSFPNYHNSISSNNRNSNGNYKSKNESRNNGSNNNPNGDSSHQQSKTILVSDLNRQTIPATLMEYFDRFEKVDVVTLNEDDDGRPTDTATIVFRKVPQNSKDIVKQHKIDGKLVRVEFTRNQPFESNPSNYNSSRLLGRTFSMGSMIGPKTFVEEWSTSDDVRFILKYTQRQVNIIFNHMGECYKVEYKFKDVLGDMHVERNDKTTTFTIPLRYPGAFWRRSPEMMTETKRSMKRGRQWERVTMIPITSDVEVPKRLQKPVMPIHPEGIINIGKWIVYRVTFSPLLRHAPEFEKKLKEAADYNLVPRDLGTRKPFIKVVSAKDLPKPWGHIERTALGLDHNVLYMLESVISYYYINEHNLSMEFYDMIKELDPAVACGILQLISSNKKQVWDPATEFANIFDRMKMKVKDQRSIPSHCALLRKVIITPSHIFIQPPTLETTNRVIRHFKDQSDRFIRVQFLDDGFNKVSASQTDMKNVIYNRIFDILKRGLQIGKKWYEFLAFSSSQLREQGCWFFAPTPELSASKIHTWMGVFSHEKVVAKHAIRMGQCFSSTRPVYVLQPQDVQRIDDIKRGIYTFSDGVGKISLSLAEQVAIQMDLKQVPSAFQFRLGGAKGVLTVDENLDKMNVKVQLRPSQIKFESEHLTLEVIRTSTYIHGYLNRQVITILSSLGVKDEVFMNLMEEMVQDVNKLLKRPEEAVRVLLGNVDEAGTALSMVPVIQAGFLERGDPYIKNLLNLFRVNVLKDLKKKAKIIVPQGAYLLGVMDETNTLREGEVFVQICDTSNNGMNRQIITGDVVVFRNPCFHPGDVRIVKAVDKESLHHLDNVIVFSSQGYRDIPSMCSGGDLDGDDYTVYWHPGLLPPAAFPPMEYKAADPQKVDDVKIRDIIKFFVNYISNDNLGTIANAHLATADASPHGARDGKCMLLAQLHSDAVDFPKSGRPAKFTPDLRVHIFPDFMQKKDKPSYPSKKVLGRIFRAIDKSDYKNYKSTLIAETVYDTRLRIPDMEMYITEARQFRLRYNRDLLALMNQFGVQTEAEICSGFIIKWANSRGRKKSDYEHHQYTMKAVKLLKATWKKRFEEEFYDSNKAVDVTKRNLIEAKAAAWYYVTYHPDERNRDMSVEGGFFSFPWCIYEYLCEIAKRSKPRDLEIDAIAPVSEEKVVEGNLKLLQLRNNSPVIVVDNDEESASEEEVEGEDENEEEEESDSEDSSDEVVISYNALTNNHYHTNNSPSRPSIHNETTHSNNPYSITNTSTPKPFSSQQPMVSAEASETELAEALLGSADL